MSGISPGIFIFVFLNNIYFRKVFLFTGGMLVFFPCLSNGSGNWVGV